MPTAMLINPAKRRRSKKGRFVKTKGRKRGKRRNPVAALAAVNPKRKRRRYGRKAKRRARRNPVGFSFPRFFNQTLMPSAVGAGGALALDIAMGMLPLPENIRTGPMRPLVKGIGAVGIGMLANMLVKSKTAEQITSGALIVVMYDVMKGIVQTQMPGIQLGQYPTYDRQYEALEYYSPNQLIGGDMDEPLGAYLDDDDMDENYTTMDAAYDEPLGAYLDDEDENEYAAGTIYDDREDLYL